MASKKKNEQTVNLKEEQQTADTSVNETDTDKEKTSESAENSVSEDFFDSDMTDDEMDDEFDDTSSTDCDMKDWLENSDDSPLNFKDNRIVEASGENYLGTLYYTPLKLKNKVDEDEIVKSDEDTFKDTLKVCVKSIKSSTYVIDDILPKFSDDEKEREHEIPYKNILFYGHPEDIFDDFGSRIDSKFIKNLGSFRESHFENVYICGAFKSPNSFLNAMKELATKFRINEYHYSNIRICLESYIAFHKDNEEPLACNVANLISSGIFSYNILDRDFDIFTVQPCYKRIPEKLIAKLYTKEFEPTDIENLFGKHKSNKESENDIETELILD